MITRTKASKLHFLPILDLLCITISPLHRNIRVRICVNEHIEGTITVKLWEEGYRGGDLSEYRLDFVLDLLFSLFGLWFCASVSLSATRIGCNVVGIEYTYSGAAFSLSTAFFAAFDFEDLLKIWT